jgi:hypothetical protein
MVHGRHPVAVQARFYAQHILPARELLYLQARILECGGGVAKLLLRPCEVIALNEQHRVERSETLARKSFPLEISALAGYIIFRRKTPQNYLS